MKASDKLRIVISIVAAIGLCGVCGAVYGNEALPMWARLLADGLAFINMICTVLTAQEMLKRSKK